MWVMVPLYLLILGDEPRSEASVEIAANRIQVLRAVNGISGYGNGVDGGVLPKPAYRFGSRDFSPLLPKRTSINAVHHRAFITWN